MHFSKLEGLGNDFIVVSGEEIPASQFSELTVKICERHFGVGADGLVFYWPASGAGESHFQMRIFNADGGEAEMSGNGLRCLAAHLFHCRLHRAAELSIDTQAGVKTLQLIKAEPPAYFFAVNMGHPILELSRIPFVPAVAPKTLQRYPLQVAGQTLPVTITSMGNPHCSLFVRDFESIDWEALGPQIERHPFFPNRTNVEFIIIRNRHEIEVRFWERGVGKTLASGTGSCAAAVAAMLNEHVNSTITVRTLGGNLELSWQKGQPVWLRGPARSICEGEYVF
jgi:diaminopimelate epimerase